MTQQENDKPSKSIQVRINALLALDVAALAFKSDRPMHMQLERLIRMGMEAEKQHRLVLGQGPANAGAVEVSKEEEEANEAQLRRDDEDAEDMVVELADKARRRKAYYGAVEKKAARKAK